MNMVRESTDELAPETSLQDVSEPKIVKLGHILKYLLTTGPQSKHLK